MNGHGKLAVYASAFVVITLVVVLVVSAGDGNGAVPNHRRPAPGKTAFRAIVNAFTGTVGAMRLSIFSYRLRTILTQLSESAPALQKKLSELSRVVQGGRCQGYLAEVLQLSDAGGPRATASVSGGGDGPVPQDPEGVWRYANDLADRYLPMFKDCLAQLEGARRGLTAVGLPAPLAESNDLLLRSCDLQLNAMRECIRGLELVKDCNEMTVGQASELVVDAVVKVSEANTWLSRADDALSRKGQPLSMESQL